MRETSTSRFELLWRVLRLLKVLTCHGSAQCLGRRLSGPERLLRVFEDLGGTFLKFGQMLALQPDIIPIEYCNALCNLLDRVAPFDFAEVEGIFQEEFGRPATQIFEFIDPKPLATASIGQVHAAVLGGCKYAVKVQRPSASSEFQSDIKLMRRMISFIQFFRIRPLYWLIEPMREFATWTAEELDYRNEARYMLKQRTNTQHNPRERVPNVLLRYTTARTLVAELLEGVTVLSRLREVNGRTQHADAVPGHDVKAVATNIIDNFLIDVFKHGMFHADLHPANLLILQDSVIGYVDFGITGTISRYSRANLVALTLAYTRGDLEGMCESFFRVSTTDRTSTPQVFREELQRLKSRWYTEDGSKIRLRQNFTLVMLDMLRLSRKTGVWPERDVIKYIRSAIAIDGLITRLAPEFDLANHLAQTCSQQLQGDLKTAVFGYDAILDLAHTCLDLITTSCERTPALAMRVLNRNISWIERPEEFDSSPSEAMSRKVLWLACFFFVMSLAVSLSHGRPQFGLNVLTVELGSLMGSGLILLWSIRHLTIHP